MKTTAFLFAACTVWLNAANAQNDASLFTDNSIVLMVSDTLPTLNGSILYDIAPVDEVLATMEYDENMDHEKIQKESNARMKKAREKLEKDLKARKYVVQEAPIGYDPYSINSYDSDNSETPALRIELRTEEELKALVIWLRTQGLITGNVSEWKKVPTASAMQDLTTRLFNQAQAKAERLAVMGGRKLGKLIAAEDYNTGSGNDYDYPDSSQGASPVIQTMRFKFSLLD
ncbi:MAG: hypothetical protein ACOH13_08315 [Flavobacteriales bacterium]